MTADLFPASTSPARPPLRYYGGKWRIAPWIIGHLPDHTAYVEVFGGAAGLLLRKPRSRIEIYNDLEAQVVAFFRVIRDPVKCAALERHLSLTPFARETFDEAYLESEDEIEGVARFVTRSAMGHGTCSMNPRDSNGFRSCDVRAGRSYAREWLGISEAVSAAGRRFQGVTIEQLDFCRCIPKFDAPTTLFYCDPPYLLGLRAAGGKGYVHEMSAEDHRHLAWMLRQVKGKVIVSGYPSELYDHLYAGWRTDTKAVSANGQRGAVPRTEVLWMNF